MTGHGLTDELQTDEIRLWIETGRAWFAPDDAGAVYVAEQCRAWWGAPAPTSRTTEWRLRAAYWSACGFPSTPLRRPFRALRAVQAWNGGASLREVGARVDASPAAARELLRRVAARREWAHVAPLLRVP